MNINSSPWYPTGRVLYGSQNYPKPGLTIVKVDSITGDPIKGAKFHITYASNDTFEGEINDLGTYYTDEAGQIKLDNLRDGWYRVTELEPGCGLLYQGILPRRIATLRQEPRKRSPREYTLERNRDQEGGCGYRCTFGGRLVPYPFPGRNERHWRHCHR